MFILTEYIKNVNQMKGKKYRSTYLLIEIILVFKKSNHIVKKTEAVHICTVCDARSKLKYV